jgi:hypothetical protein
VLVLWVSYEGAACLSLSLLLECACWLLLLLVMRKLQNMQCSFLALPSAYCTLVGFFVQVMCLLSRMSLAESQSVHAVAS